MSVSDISKLHAAAIDLAKRGISVFPCAPKSKVPACQRGVHEATTDLERLESWWGKIPDLNIGVATGAVSGFFVLDVDGENGEASLRELEAKYGALPPTVEVITGKGRHLYFRLGEHPIGNTAGTIAAGLDTRGDGGYVLAPPSLHPSGARYCWSVDSGSELADAPEWLYELLGSQREGQGKPLEHWHALLTHSICNGTRNTTLASIAGKLLFHNVNLALINDLLGCVNEARCVPPMSSAEIEAIVCSVAKKHLRERR